MLDDESLLASLAAEARLLSDAAGTLRAIHR